MKAFPYFKANIEAGVRASTAHARLFVGADSAFCATSVTGWLKFGIWTLSAGWAGLGVVTDALPLPEGCAGLLVHAAAANAVRASAARRNWFDRREVHMFIADLLRSGLPPHAARVSCC